MPIYRVIKQTSYEPKGKPKSKRIFMVEDRFAYPSKGFPTQIPIEWLLETGAIEEIKEEVKDG